MYKGLVFLIVCVSSISAQYYGGFNSQQKKCIIPAHPENGVYHIVNIPSGKPGESYSNLEVRVICSGSYRVEGELSVNCFNGMWFGSLQKCVSSSSAQQEGRGYPNSSEGKCTLPPYPEHGSFISSVPNAKPGEVYTNININVICHQGYTLEGPQNIICLGGWWMEKMPECVSTSDNLDDLDKRFGNNSESADHKCVFPSQPQYGSLDSDIDQPKTGARYKKFRINTKCREGHTLIGSPTVTCDDGQWFGNMPNCITAHCFWDSLEGLLPASEYTIKVGNVYRDFDSKLEKSQRSKVKSIRIPKRFKGSETNFQDDIAVLELSTRIEFTPHIQPVCLDFQPEFDDRQLQEGTNGTVAGWGLTTEFGHPARELRIVELPYVDIDKCFKDSPLQFKPLLTSDKICAGYENAGTALCQGDSGGGLAIPKMYKGTTRYFLRGIASTSPTDDVKQCNSDSYTAFTWLRKHDRFITKAILGEDSNE